MKEVAELLVRHYGLHEGQYDLMVEYQIGTGPIGPQPGAQVPGLLFGVAKLGLSKVDEIGPLTVDAAVTNPVRKPRARTPG